MYADSLNYLYIDWLWFGNLISLRRSLFGLHSFLKLSKLLLAYAISMCILYMKYIFFLKISSIKNDCYSGNSRY